MIYYKPVNLAETPCKLSKSNRVAEMVRMYAILFWHFLYVFHLCGKWNQKVWEKRSSKIDDKSGKGLYNYAKVNFSFKKTPFLGSSAILISNFLSLSLFLYFTMTQDTLKFLHIFSASVWTLKIV